MSICVELHLKEREVVLVGGGEVAYRKALRFLAEGANVTIISIDFIESMKTLENVSLLSSAFSWDLIHQPFLLYVASNDIVLNASIVEEAKRRNIVCGSAQFDVHSTFTSMKDIELEHLHVALSSKGNCPGAASVFLKEMEVQFTSYDEKSKYLKVIRERVLKNEQGEARIEILKQVAKLPDDVVKKIANATKHSTVLLLSYHGIANKDHCLSQMHTMEKEVACQFPHLTPISLFLSEKIVNKANRKGFAISTLDNMVRILNCLEVSYWIQPMLLSDGVYAQRIQRKYPNHSLGQPLLNTEADAKRLYGIMRKQYPNASLCLIYHTSESAVSSWFQGIERDQFLSYQDYQTVIRQDSLRLIPLSIFLGYHAQKDIENLWIPHLLNQHIEVELDEYALLDHLEVRRMFLERIEAINNSQ